MLEKWEKVAKLNTWEQSQLRKWDKLIPGNETAFYNNPIIRFLFDFGHRYIASRGRGRRGVVLDAGCGAGYHLQFEIIDVTRKYICLDSNAEVLKKIPNRSPHIKKLLRSCERTGLKKESIDVLIASHLLEHVRDLDVCLKEFKRILKPNGVFLVVLPCDPGFLWKLTTRFTPSRSRLEKAGLDYDFIMSLEHINSYNDVVGALKRCFTVKETRYYPFAIPNYHFNLLGCMTLRKRRS